MISLEGCGGRKDEWMCFADETCCLLVHFMEFEDLSSLLALRFFLTGQAVLFCSGSEQIRYLSIGAWLGWAG